MTTSFNASTPLLPGTIIVGKWHRGKYRVERLLGQGANGAVYLVQRDQSSERAALKIGYDAVDLQSEINVLTSLAGQQAKRERRMRSQALRPFLLDVDDFCAANREVPFYVMRYVQGCTLQQYINKQGSDWFGVTGLRLLTKLAALHDMGWVFGDLKAENVLVSDYGDVELVDYGGVSPIGRSVKQFTEWYDRGFWNAGSRTADPGYDLFSFAVLWLHVLDGGRLRRQFAGQLPQTRQGNDLLQLVRSNPQLKPYEDWFKKAIRGQFPTSSEACAQWQQVSIRSGGRVAKHVRNAKTPGWLKGVFIAALVLLASTLYLVLQS